MKLHPTLIEKLITTFQVYAGWRDEKKLRKALADLDIATYTQQNGNQILVDSEELEKEQRNIKENR